jgi:hypothetical protein
LIAAVTSAPGRWIVPDSLLKGGIDSTCSNCGRQLNERKRKPCPTCHGMARTIAVYANDQLAAADKAN